MRETNRALDGLRAAAVLLVFQVHMAGPLPGGRLGVDVFFVLSGFLITTLLLQERDRAGQIRLGAFYARRAARLYPALVLVVAVAGVAPLTFGVKRYPEAALYALTYVRDLTWWEPINTAGLTQTWSLAVEEQFYLAWPLLLIFARSRRRLAWICAVGVLASFAALVMSGAAGPGDTEAAGYYQPHTRAFELLAGCAAALAMPWIIRAPRRPVVAAGWLGTAGLGWLAVSGPSLLTGPDLAVALGAATCCSVGLVAALAVAPDMGVGRLLSLPPVAWVGRISYGVYLMHPLVVAALADRIPGPWTVRFAGVAAATVLAVAASFYVVERPIRDAVRARLRGSATQDDQSVRVA